MKAEINLIHDKLMTLPTNAQIDEIHDRLSKSVRKEDLDYLKLDMNNLASLQHVEEVTDELQIVKKGMSRFVQLEDHFKRIQVILSDLDAKIDDMVPTKQFKLASK